MDTSSARRSTADSSVVLSSHSRVIDIPTPEAIRVNRDRLNPFIVTTPVRRVTDERVLRLLAPDTDLWLKEELFQETGSFKPRGALTVMLGLSQDALARGVTAVSAGNHAIAVAYSARRLGSTAKVVMPRTASPYRIGLCRELGGVVELASDVHEAFARVREIERTEQRTFVHPYEGPTIALGTATLGLELVDQFRANGAPLDAVVVAAGGGGLTGGVACAVKQLSPSTSVFVVEPYGANSLFRSINAGAPQAIERVETIADSLGAPRCEPYSFALNQRFVDEVVLVDDDEIRHAMRLLFEAAKLAVEPAGAAALAAMLHPLRDRLRGRRACAVVCGGNIDIESFYTQIKAAPAAASGRTS